MLPFSSWLNDFFILIGVAGAAAFIVAYFKTDVTKKTVAQLKDLAEALDMRVKALEEEKESLVDRINHLEEENTVLRSLLDGSQNADELKAQMEKNHLEILTLFEKTIDRLERLISK